MSYSIDGSGSSPSSLSVIFEDEQMLVLDKPAGLDCQNSKPDKPSVVDFLRQRFGFSGLVHRLDFNTSGVLVCAKNTSAAEKLTQLFQNGGVQKIYWAVVLGKILPTEGILEQELDGKACKTEYRVLESYANASLLEVQLHTGRKHQIRRHLAGIKHPVLGDHLYGNQAAKLLFHRPALHARKIQLLERTHESPLPNDIQQLLEKFKRRI